MGLRILCLLGLGVEMTNDTLQEIAEIVDPAAFMPSKQYADYTVAADKALNKARKILDLIEKRDTSLD